MQTQKVTNLQRKTEVLILEDRLCKSAYKEIYDPAVMICAGDPKVPDLPCVFDFYRY